MSEVKVNKISPRSGTAITLGDSGDTFTIPSGATLAIAGSVTGFTSAGIDDNATSVAITINSSEQVGIGTTSFDQDAKLTIAGSGSGGSNPSSISANTVATFRRTGGTSHVANISVLSGTTGASILNLGDRDDEDVGNIIYEHSSNYMAFTTGASERLRITSGGDVGIGTSAPNRLLTLGGTANARLGLNASSYRNYSLSSDVYGFSIYDDTSTAYRLTVNASGQVGIGTTSPTRNLQIQSSASTIVSINSGNSSESQLFFADTDDDNIGRIAYDHSTNAMEFWTNDNERMRITSAGKVLVNTTGEYAGTGAEMTVNDGIDVGTTSTANGGFVTFIGDGVGQIGEIGSKVSGYSTMPNIEFHCDNVSGGSQAGHIEFNTKFSSGSRSEAMRIASNGDLMLGGTSRVSPEGVGLYIENAGGNDGGIIELKHTRNAGGSRDFIRFFNSADGEAGAIVHSGTTSVTYATSSDYRLKENVDYNFDATTRLKQLKPARFNFITEPEKTVDGFIAHEVSSIVPEAITGEKDAINSKGKPSYQGIDQSKLVPLLVKTIQELEARITTLEANNP